MAGAIVRLRSAWAAVGGIRQLSSSAVGLMVAPDKVYWLGEEEVASIDDEKELEWSSDRVVGSSHGWVGLMKLEEDRVRCGGSSSSSSSSSDVSLWNPMSGSRMMLPRSLTRLPGVGCCSKLMVDDSECRRAIIVGCGLWMGVCWAGGRSSEWTRFGVGEDIEDAVVACSGRRFYTLGYGWELVRWNVSDPGRPRRDWKKNMNKVKEEEKFPRGPARGPLDADYTCLHLVYAEQSGELFLLTRHYCEERDIAGRKVADKTVAFDVHLILENETRRRVDGVRYMEHSLDGLVMFVGINNSFAVAAADFPHLKPDSIYFTDHPEANEPHDVGIYDYKNRTIHSSFYHPAHLQTYPFLLTG